MRANLLLPAVCGLTVSVCSCTPKGQNPPDDGGDGKKPVMVVEQFLPIADPSILYYDGTYYAYGTSSDAGFEAYYTEDENLKQWKRHPRLILARNDSYGDRWFWAPEVYYNSANKTFYLYYSAEEHICVATGPSPLGPFTQTVKEPMRSEKSIDSSLFIDDDGTPYLFFVRFTDGNVIWAAELEDDLMTIKEETLTRCITASLPWETVQAKVAEGPSVLRRGDTYYMLYSANHYENVNYGVGYATAASPLGPWTKSDGNPIFQKPKAGLVGTGHGAPFVDAEGKLRYVFHAHSSTTAIHPRKMYITDMSIAGGDVTLNKDTIISPLWVK